jgi:hypothetical protein
VAFFVAILLVVVGYFFFVSQRHYNEALSIGKDVGSFKELSDRFVDLATERGAIYAFEVLRRAPLPPQTDLHLLGHVVGDELYKQEGIEGIQYCTPDFRNACSHTIVIGALAEFGEGALPEIRDACAQAPGGSGAYTMCFHGLGHGVFAGYGYRLPETVAFCEKTGTETYNEREYIECFGGAIMELMGGGGHDPQLWEEARDIYITGPLAPCLSDDVPEELRGICLTYATPQIWAAAGIELGSPDPKKFKTAFAFCEEIPKEKEVLREACYSGFGKEFVPLAGKRDIRDISSYTNFDFTQAINWCLASEDIQGQKWCIAESLDSIFWGGENNPEASFRYCSLVGDLTKTEYKNICEQRLANNINFYIQDFSQKEGLCKQLPESLQDQCLDRAL